MPRLSTQVMENIQRARVIAIQDSLISSAVKRTGNRQKRFFNPLELIGTLHSYLFGYATKSMLLPIEKTQKSTPRRSFCVDMPGLYKMRRLAEELNVVASDVSYYCYFNLVTCVEPMLPKWHKNFRGTTTLQCNSFKLIFRKIKLYPLGKVHRCIEWDHTFGST